MLQTKLKAIVDQSLDMMSGQAVDRIEMSSSTYAKLLLDDVFGDDTFTLRGVPIETRADVGPDVIQWINPDGIRTHILILPDDDVATSMAPEMLAAF